MLRSIATRNAGSKGISLARRWSLPLLAAIVGVFVLALNQPVSSQSSDASKPKTAAGAKAQVARGEYLVTAMGCNDCHTPWTMGPQGPQPDMTRMLSGHPQNLKMPPAPQVSGPWMWTGSGTMTSFAGPWGISYAANLTPDENTGLGIWTEEMFVKALRTGKHMGTSRQIQPPMPWIWYGKLTDDDLKAVYAYLRTVPKINNLVPDYEPPATPTN